MKRMRGWGDLNVALNGLVRAGIIRSYQTNREDCIRRGAALVISITAADQATAVDGVKVILSGPFEDAEVRITAA